MALDWHDRYRLPREPDCTLRPMTPADIAGAVILNERIGWEHQAADWERLLAWSPQGCFVIEDPAAGIVGTVTTTSYGTALAWIGMMIVHPDWQRRGLGGQLMRAALDHLIAQGTERIMLDATDAGRSLYRRMGFREIHKVERWEGRASTYLGPRARRLRPDDVPAVLALDRTLFGVDRSFILARLLDEFPDLAWVDVQDRQVQGYLLGRRTRSGVHLGPWMSWTVASAERLLLVAFEQLQGQPVIFQVPDRNARGLILLGDHNLRRVRHCTRMIYGDATPVAGEPLAELAVAMLATG